jgi:dephospho-CoA kinase
VAPTNYGESMLRLGITGGIGSGKSAAEKTLRDFGIRVLDADQVARDVVEPGMPAWRALVDAFGTAILKPDDTLDRDFVASITFPYPANLRRLNSITHGLIGAAILQWIEEVGTGPFAIALPLFRPAHREIFGLNEVWALEVDPQTAVERLVRFRGLNEVDARARIDAQISNRERAEIVDRVIRNEGSLSDLHDVLAELLREKQLGE